MKVPEIKLNNGELMPGIGFGTWQIRGQACVDSVKAAVQAGYRLFDTAQIYGNEQFVAEGLATAGLDRKDAFITTKISVHNFLHVDKSLAESLDNLNSSYVDLLLLHFPVIGVRKQAWKKLEKAYTDCRARSIGVSNYTVRHLMQLFEYIAVKPAVNQVELHVYLQQPELLAFCEEQGIVVEAYSPLARGQRMDNSILRDIGLRHGKTPAQVMLRWCIDVGTVPIPKSVTPERIRQNIDVFDFELTIEDMQQLQTLEQGFRTCWDPTRTP